MIVTNFEEEISTREKISSRKIGEQKNKNNGKKIYANKKLCPICLDTQISPNSLEETCDYCEDFFHFECGGIKLNGKKYYEELTYLCPFCFFLISSRHYIKPHPNYLNHAAIGKESKYKSETNQSILLMPPISGSEITENIKESEKKNLFNCLASRNLTFNDNLTYENNEIEQLNNIRYEPDVQVFFNNFKRIYFHRLLISKILKQSKN